MNEIKKIEKYKDILDKRKNEYNLLYQFIARIYKDELVEYNNLLKFLIKFINELNISNEIEYSILISYLIDNGYLSNNLKFIRKSCLGYKMFGGLNIITGNGVCRDYSDMHKDIFNKLNINSSKLYCSIYKGLFLEDKAKYFANHVANTIKYKDNLYIIDIMNQNRLFHFINECELREIKSEDFKYKIRYMLSSDYIFNNKSIEDIKFDLQKYKKESKKNIISDIEYFKMKYYFLKYLDNNKDLFMDFHNETKNLKEYISTSINSKDKILIKEFSK